MKRILFTNDYSKHIKEFISTRVPCNFTIVYLDSQSEQCLMNVIPSADYLVVGGRLRIGEKVLSVASRLKMIQRSGSGLDTLDVEAIKKANIPLYMGIGVNARSVAEYTLMAMLCSMRNLPYVNNTTHNRIWKRHQGALGTYELSGKTVGIVGMGSIAKILVTLLQPFGVKILYNSLQRQDATYEAKNGMVFVAFEELLCSSDIITLHCPLTENTKNIISKKSISLMKDGVVLINTSRGLVVNDSDLYAALLSGKIGYAVLDVHTEEPIGYDCLFSKLDNVILTPHIAGITHDSFARMIDRCMDNIRAFDEGRLCEIEKYLYRK